MFSNFSIRLLDKNTLYSLEQVCKPEIESIRLRLKLSSVNENSPVKFETLVIKLFAKFKTLKSARWLIFSILEILLLCKSSTSSFVKL